MILVKNFEFTLSSFFFKIGLDKPFDYVQHRKQGFVDHKNDIRENCRNFHFSKGVNPWFWSKILKFSLSLFFLKIGLDKLYQGRIQGEGAGGAHPPSPRMTCGRFLINTVQSLDRHTKSALSFDMYSQQFTLCYFLVKSPLLPIRF